MPAEQSGRNTASWPNSSANPAGGDVVVITVWPSHEVFDAWIATPQRDALTASDVHRAITYRPIIRYDVPGGYLNLPALALCDIKPPTEFPPTKEST
jgi:hypothetical protein